MKVLLYFVFYLTKLTHAFKISKNWCQTYNYSEPHQYSTKEQNENTDCFYVHDKHDLPSADNKKFSTGTIFFIETACKGGLNSREVCSVEAAARTNPKRNIVVLFAGPVRQPCLKTSPMATLLSYKRVKLYRIHINLYSKGSPFEEWMVPWSWQKLMKKSLYPICHTSNALSFLTLWKFGGTYLDLDVLLIKSLNLLPKRLNWVGKEDRNSIGSAVLSFSKDVIGRHMANECVRILKETYKPEHRKYNSIGVISKALQTICTEYEVDKLTKANCEGFAVYNPEYFYSIPDYKWPELFRYKTTNLKSTWFGFHMWNKLSHDKRIIRGSFYDRLTHKFCPKAYARIT